jgi:acyl-coenzyme A synthetase/AMP-(fatty) acid ligase
MRELSSGFDQGLTLNPDVNLQIVDEDDSPLPQGSIGRIRYTRHGIASSYLANPQASKESFKDGYFYPGDLGLIDANGDLILKGRSTDVINIGGVKVNPEAIEKIAINQLGVLDCAAFSHTSTSGADELAILLVVNEDFDQESFTKVMLQKSPMAPKVVFQAASIPRNENGKIVRRELTRLYAAR